MLGLGDDRRVVAEAALAGCERICGARRRVEPHDAVVHGDAAVRRDVFRPERREQCLRHRRDVAMPVDHGEMRGAGGRQIFGAERALAVGIAHVLEPLAEGRLQGERIFDIGGRVRRARRLQTLLQQAQRMCHGRAGRELRRRIDLAVTIGDRQRLAQMAAERGEILDRERAAVSPDVGCNAPGEVALIEVARASFGEVRERRLQRVLRQPCLGLDAPGRTRRQAVLQKCSRARGIASEICRRTRDRQCGPPVRQQPLAGERHRRSNQILPRHPGVSTVRLLHAGDDTWHGDRAGTVNVAIVLHPRPGEQVGSCAFSGDGIIGGAQALRRGHAVVDHLVAIFVGAVEHHCAAAADAAVPGLQNVQRKGGRHDRVDAVAARCQHLRPDLGRAPRLRRDNAAPGCDGGFADGLVEAELMGHVACACLVDCFGFVALTPKLRNWRRARRMAHCRQREHRKGDATWQV